MKRIGGRVLLSVVLMALIVGLTGCSGGKSKDESAEQAPTVSQGITGTITPTEEPEKMKLTKHLPIKSNVKLLGRTHHRGEVAWLTYSASGIEFRFEGKQCVIELVADNTVNSAGHRARVAVYVDDVRIWDTLMHEKEASLTVIDSEETQSATIRVVKLSEVSDSVVGVAAIATDDAATIEPTEEKNRKIEFIGDSITCGYGVDGTLQDLYDTAIEDATKTYAYLAAELLDADYSMVCQSGYGIISGYTGTGDKNGGQIIPPYYTTQGNSMGMIEGKILTKVLEWDFSAFVPDTIVINLGTNDYSYCGSDVAKREEFAAGYVEFLKLVREHNPDAEIVCALGIMGAELYGSIETAVATYTGETGDTNIRTFRFDVQNQAQDGIAVDYHPSATTHQKAAAKLAEALKQ